jgi:hypothetical protein
VPFIREVLGGTVDTSGNFWIAGRMMRSAAIGGIWSVATFAAFAPDGRLLRHQTIDRRDTSAQAIAIGGAGNVWISGTVLGTQSPFGAPLYSFVSRVGPDGEEKRLLQIGGDRRVCSGGSGCISAWGFTTLPHIALGPGGMVAVAGSTSSVGMKVSSNGIQTSAGGGVLAILNSDGTPLLETYLGGSPTYIGPVSCGAATVEGLAFDGEGMLYAGGINRGVRPVTTPGVIQAEAPLKDPGCALDPANEIGFLYRIDPRSGRVLFSTMLGGETGAVRGLYA